MKHGTKIKKTRWAAVIALALVAVPVAQAKPVTIQKAQSSQAETAQGLMADGMRLQAEAKTYAYSQEIRSESLARMREAKALSQSMAGSYAKGTQLAGTTSYPFVTSASQGYEGMQAYQASLAQAGLVQHYPVANENTVVVAPEPQANAGQAPISENSPVVQRLETQPSPAPISENSPVELRLQPSSQVTVSATGRGFAWRDAGIGAGLAALLTSMLVLGASGVLARRRIAHA